MDYFTRTCAMRHVDGVIQTPDGRRVPVDYDDPMGCMGQIAQNDFAIMEQRGEEHVLTAAVLCFPASWLLAEKFMRNLWRCLGQRGHRIRRLFIFKCAGPLKHALKNQTYAEKRQGPSHSHAMTAQRIRMKRPSVFSICIMDKM